MKNDHNTMLAEKPHVAIFLSISVICLLWIVIYTPDYSGVSIQSPISFGSNGTEKSSSNRSAKTVPASVPVDQDLPTIKLKPSTKKKDVVEVDNDAAPSIDFAPEDAKAYIQKFAAIAVEEMHNSGIPASVSMAQALVESRAGTSGLALTANNHFGIKCHQKGKCPSTHCINFSDDGDNDYFILYQNAYRSWKGHTAFLQRPNYKKCFQQTSYQGWCRELKAAGYATYDGYDKLLIKTIERHKLYMLDNK